MKKWVLHFDNIITGEECSREYSQSIYKKWENIVDMMHKEQKKGNKFFNENLFNGKCALVDKKQNRQFVDAIGSITYGLICK